MYILQDIFSTTAGTIMVLATLIILTIVCISLSISGARKERLIEQYKDCDEIRELEHDLMIRELQLDLQQDYTNWYTQLSYLLFRILYDLIGEHELTTSIHRLTTLHDANMHLENDVRISARTIIEKVKTGIKMDDPDFESIIMYITSIMNIHGGAAGLSKLSELDYYETLHKISDLQKSIVSKEIELNRLYQDSTYSSEPYSKQSMDMVTQEIEEDWEDDESELPMDTPTRTYNPLSWIKDTVNGLRYFEEDDE